MTAKISHEECHYRAATSTTKCCATCSMYRSGKPASCTLVVRPIRPGGLCDYYKKTESTAKREAA